MTDKELKVTIGGLLHDIGKVIYREGNEKRTHSQIGFEYLKENIGIEDRDILECVKYHHGKALSNSSISDDSLAYVVYIADNIASSVDRREKMSDESGFELHTPLQPVFNLLNENNGKDYYSTNKLNVEESINFPSSEKGTFAKEEYAKIVNNLTDNLKGIDYSSEYVNSLLEVMEANLSFVPSSTSAAEVPDISLYDHLKLTAAISSAIVKYLEDEESDYKSTLFKAEKAFYEKEAFLIASMDISGIQKFIYTIQTKNALKTLRARSFYLEIVMEHIIDELLNTLGLSRCNLLYVGGGHCYLLLPNTQQCKTEFDEFIKRTNQWFLEKFQTELYIAGGYGSCSANSLKNIPSGSYEDIFKRVSSMISEHKICRYDADVIKALNSIKHDDYTRECSVCKRIAVGDDNELCPICSGFEKLSAKVLYADFFTVERDENKDLLPLPGGYSLSVDTDETLKKKMETSENFVRAYCKNRSYTGKHIATKLWVGSYSAKATFEEFSNTATGINRIGVLRADVDNLGNAFVSGFRNKANDNRYMTISRTATLSRQLSLFFKLHINKLLENPEFSLDGKTKEKRNITIVYSGGDDVFVVGSWNEVIEFAVDLSNAFKKYTENTLTISAGIGVYTDNYPISVIASEVEQMEDESKDLSGKDAITLLEDGEFHNEAGQSISDGTYKWQEFETGVIAEKLKTISTYMDATDNPHGNGLLYRILELIRNQSERINLARFVYLLARLEPDSHSDNYKEIKAKFDVFSKDMIRWINNERDRRHLKTAIELYVYMHRGEETN